jgi:hypothetical protein
MNHSSADAPAALELLTVTWAADAAQFDLLRASLARSALADVPHGVVVHTEDQPRFAAHASGVDLRSTASVLPGNLEAGRHEAQRWRDRLGRHGTKWAGSLTRVMGLPHWPRYMGWHLQQISKLASVAASQAGTVLVLDSDLIVMPRARVDDFRHPQRPVCLTEERPAATARGKVANWHREAHRLLDLSPDPNGAADLYFDTPFPMHPPSVRALFTWLEQRYQCPWWTAILNQPPRRWSEFATYRLFLRHHPPATGVHWMAPTLTRFIYDATDLDALTAQLDARAAEPDCHYITLHAQSSGRGLWDAETVVPHVRRWLEQQAS